MRGTGGRQSRGVDGADVDALMHWGKRGGGEGGLR